MIKNIHQITPYNGLYPVTKNWVGMGIGYIYTPTFITIICIYTYFHYKLTFIIMRAALAIRENVYDIDKFQ